MKTTTRFEVRVPGDGEIQWYSAIHPDDPCFDDTDILAVTELAEAVATVNRERGGTYVVRIDETEVARFL